MRSSKLPLLSKQDDAFLSLINHGQLIVTFASSMSVHTVPFILD